MKNTADHIALVLFVRTPAEEARAKAILSRRQHTRQKHVFAAFTARTTRVLAKTQLPYFVYTATGQPGETFGSRLRHCLAETFARGFDKVLVVGNDCPALESADLLLAAEKLGETQAVIGPDRRGGVYLIGLTKELFERLPEFAGLAWQSRELAGQLQHLLENKGSQVGLLKVYADVNTRQDLEKFLLKKAAADARFSWLRELIWDKPPCLDSFNFFLPLAVAGRQPRFRGPPAL